MPGSDTQVTPEIVGRCAVGILCCGVGLVLAGWGLKLWNRTSRLFAVTLGSMFGALLAILVAQVAQLPGVSCANAVLQPTVNTTIDALVSQGLVLSLSNSSDMLVDASDNGGDDCDAVYLFVGLSALIGSMVMVKLFLTMCAHCPVLALLCVLSALA